jgi:hypothetical protein
MFSCEKCGNLFRDRYNLTSHQSRTRPCVKENNCKKILYIPNTLTNIPNTLTNIPNTLTDIPNTLTDIPNTLTDIPNTLTDIPNTLDENESNTCRYCLHNFSTVSNKIKHIKNCKYIDDPVRLLEIENDIIPELPESKTECRFCNKIFSRIDNLNKHITSCKERKVYHQTLTKEKDKRVLSIQNNCTNNNTNCNNVNNINNNVNNLILNFGQTNDVTKTEELVDCLRIINKNYKIVNSDLDQFYLMAGELINNYDKMLLKLPENNNMVIPDSKCLYAEIKTPEGWEKESIEIFLNTSFKDRANKIYNKKEEINVHNERVFKNTNNIGVFSELKQFGNKGFGHSYCGKNLRTVKTNYKLNKLKNKKTV